jgi:phosphinothricin acetyltransferase|tara:strand:- start:108 stop:575 length:468 start_codon:yes stop_codon:yes gene_type:complete
MKIRKAQIKDLQEIDEIYREGQLDEEKNKSPRKSKKEILKELVESKKVRQSGFKKAINSSKENFLVCEENNELIAFGDAVVSSKNKGAEVALIYVRKEYRGKGIGKKIMKELLKWLKEKGENKVFVTTDIENKASINLNKKAGFKESIIIMEKKL